MKRRVFPGLLCLAILTLGAFAGNPANPILFVTQVPMPDEVNSRTITVSTQSCVSPFSNHLADTGHAGRGGSLHVRFNAGASNGAVYDLLALADWSAVAGGKPAANTVAVRNPSVNWTADKALFSMVIGAPSGAQRYDAIPVAALRDHAADAGAAQCEREAGHHESRESTGVQQCLPVLRAGRKNNLRERPSVQRPDASHAAR